MFLEYLGKRNESKKMWLCRDHKSGFLHREIVGNLKVRLVYGRMYLLYLQYMVGRRMLIF